ncbi:MAG TPA: response regulator [Opitutaceae bacterium]|nr:response regulator [Opitutaceae bacterium]
MKRGKPQPPPPARPRVLLVDDEPALLDAMQQGMTAEFDVETAKSAAEAETRIGKQSFAVLICDHMLPGEAGLDFLVRMRELHPDMRRILLTGYINPELISRSVAVAELSACLLKPAHAAELSAAVRAAIAK